MSSHPPAELEGVVRARDGRGEGNEIRFRCPNPDQHANGDADPSARYHLGKALWVCDVCGGGGGWKDLCKRLGVPIDSAQPGRAQVVATYLYCFEDSVPLRRKLRWQPGFDGKTKSFSWEKPEGRDKWVKCKGDGNPGVLYGSQLLPAARGTSQTAFVVEGEKDCDSGRALGVLALCNPEGATEGRKTKWKEEYSRQLSGLPVVVIADKDGPGRAHAENAAQSLSAHAASVRVLELPGEHVKDLSDWIASQRHKGAAETEIRAALKEITDRTPPWKPTETAGEGPAQPAARGVQNILDDLKALPEPVDLDLLKNLLKELSADLEGLDQLGVAVAREGILRALTGKVNAPGRLVDAALAGLSRGRADSGVAQGAVLELTEPVPWEEPVDGAELLEELERFFCRFIVLPEGASIALTLWTLQAHAHAAFDISPLLVLSSPEKRCGKTTALALLGKVVPKALPASNITPAALFRAVESLTPTLLIDEADSFLREREELRGILNSGHTRSTAFVVRTVGDTHEVCFFSTWAPKVIALIGGLSSTLADRSIVIQMRRKAPSERVERLRLDRLGEIADMPRRAARWSGDHLEELRRADPETPAGLHDRAADNWRPLLAIADVAAGTWPERARHAAILLSGGEAGKDSSARVQLLTDLRDAFQRRGADRLFTDALLEDLVAREDRPWAEWTANRPISGNSLARLLKGFGIKPRKIRIAEEVRQGYLVGAFSDAFARYLPSHPEHPEQTNADKGLPALSNRNMAAGVPDVKKPENSSPAGFVPGVPDGQGAFFATEGDLDSDDAWGAV